MGRTVPEGYLRREEYESGDRGAVVWVPAASAWKTAEKQRQMAAMLLEIFCGDEGSASTAGCKALSELHKNEAEKSH